MASSVSATSLSTLMQSELATLAARGASGLTVTTAEMCDALANAIATEVNNTIVSTYQTHTHGYVGAGTGSSTQTSDTPDQV